MLYESVSFKREPEDWELRQFLASLRCFSAIETFAKMWTRKWNRKKKNFPNLLPSITEDPSTDPWNLPRTFHATCNMFHDETFIKRSLVSISFALNFFLFNLNALAKWAIQNESINPKACGLPNLKQSRLHNLREIQQLVLIIVEERIESFNFPMRRSRVYRVSEVILNLIWFRESQCSINVTSVWCQGGHWWLAQVAKRNVLAGIERFPLHPVACGLQVIVAGY